MIGACSLHHRQLSPKDNVPEQRPVYLFVCRKARQMLSLESKNSTIGKETACEQLLCSQCARCCSRLECRQSGRSGWAKQQPDVRTRSQMCEAGTKDKAEDWIPQIPTWISERRPSPNP